MKIIILLLIFATTTFAQIATYPTQNSGVEFFHQPSDGGIPQQASVGARNPATNKILWEKKLAMASAIKIQPSPNGKYLALIIGESREGMAYPALANSSNTLYIIDGVNGKVLSKTTPLMNSKKTAWAESAWQNLTMQLSNTTLTLSGNLFTNPGHPKKLPYEVVIPLPKM